MTPQDQLVQKVFERLWVEINKDVDEDDVHNPLDAVCAKDWMEYRAFPLLFPGHCFRCHGFEDGPCEIEPGLSEHGPECPGCWVENRRRTKVIEPCERCGCARSLHRVNVGGERTGCFDHLDCDEWQPEIEPDRYDCYAPSDCQGPPCGCPEAAHE